MRRAKFYLVQFIRKWLKLELQIWIFRTIWPKTILAGPLNVCLILLINYFKLITDI